MSNIAVANRNTHFFDRTKLFHEWVQMDDVVLPGVGWKVWALSRNIFSNSVEAEKLRPLGKWCYLQLGIFGPRLVHSFCLRRTPAFKPSLNCPAKEPPATEESAAASEVLPALASARVWREMLLATLFQCCPYMPLQTYRPATTDNPCVCVWLIAVLLVIIWPRIWGPPTPPPGAGSVGHHLPSLKVETVGRMMSSSE